MVSTTLTLITINTWKGDGLYRQRLTALVNQLRVMQPGIVACQEVFRAAEADTGRTLADSLEMACQFVPARYKSRLLVGERTESYSGLGLLSHYPIVAMHTLLLPTDVRDGERVAQFTTLDCDSITVLVINTHLTYLRDGSALRIQQLKTILTHPVLTQHAGPVFLCGDFNAGPLSEEIQFLLTYPAFSVRDSYVAGQGQLPGYTMTDQTNDKSAGGSRIDYIFSLAKKDQGHPAIINARVVFDRPGDTGVYPSDHFGVMIQAQFSPA